MCSCEYSSRYLSVCMPGHALILPMSCPCLRKRPLNSVVTNRLIFLYFTTFARYGVWHIRTVESSFCDYALIRSFSVVSAFSSCLLPQSKDMQSGELKILNCPQVRVWMYVSVCLPCDGLATRPGCFLAFCSMSTGIAFNPCNPGGQVT